MRAAALWRRDFLSQMRTSEQGFGVWGLWEVISATGPECSVHGGQEGLPAPVGEETSTHTPVENDKDACLFPEIRKPHELICGNRLMLTQM